MSCRGCKKLGHIAKGYGVWAVETIVAEAPKQEAQKRKSTCQHCEARTYISAVEAMSLIVTGQDFPIKHENPRNYNLWCSVCKCNIEPKIRVQQSECLLDKWDS